MHPKHLDSKVLERLHIMHEESALGAGFAISRRDLQLRGAGSLFGEAQKGSRSNVGDIDQYHQALRRMAAAPDVSVAATSFANNADATGVTVAISQCEMPKASPLAATPALSSLSATPSTVAVANANAPSIPSFPKPPSRVPCVVVAGQKQECWWDGASGGWRRPDDDSLHLLRPADRAAARAEQVRLEAEEARLAEEEARMRQAACEQIDAEARRRAIDGSCLGLNDWKCKMKDVGARVAADRAAEASRANAEAQRHHMVVKGLAANRAMARAKTDAAFKAKIAAAESAANVANMLERDADWFAAEHAAAQQAACQ